LSVTILESDDIDLDIVSRVFSTLLDLMKTNLSTLKIFILTPLLVSVLLGSCTWCINEVSGSSPRPVEEVEFEVEEAVVVRKQREVRKNYLLLFVNKPVPHKFLFTPPVLPPRGHRLSSGILAPLIT
jgi:hypothetical protein